MMTELTSRNVRYKKPSETRNVAVDFSDALDADSSINETIDTILAITADGLSISNEAITTVVRKFNGRVVPIGKALTFTVADGDIGDYEIECRVLTSGGQIIDRTLPLQVRAS